jgi:phage shock protein A
VVTYRGLGFDPTPGSVDAVAHTIRQLRAAADALSSVAPSVEAAGRRTASWHGQAADAFRARLAVPPTDPAQLRAAIPVLEQWADTLAEHQRRAEELDATALRLRRQLDDARDTLQDKQNALDLASTPAAAAGASVAVTSATVHVAEAEAALDDVVAEARDLARTHLRKADEAAAALATDAAPAPDSPAIRALAGMLNRTARTSSALAGLLTPGVFATPPRGAVATAVTQPFTGTGDLITLGETEL